MSVLRIDDVQIASPCSVTWDDMDGDDKVRHCYQCKLNVYNVAAMEHREAVELLGLRDDICIRLFRRKDGTVITRDCPIGLKVMKRYARILNYRRHVYGDFYFLHAVQTRKLYGVFNWKRLNWKICK